MTDTRLAFLAAIRSAPDEDLPRLVMADWLDENGEPERAAVIRTQIAQHSGNAGKCIMRLPMESVVNYRRGFACLYNGPFASWVQHSSRILPESVGLTVRLTDRPVMEYLDLISHVAVRLMPGKLAEQIYRPGVTTVETMLSDSWPEVAKWELPPELPPQYADSEWGQAMHDMITNSIAGEYRYDRRS